MGVHSSILGYTYWKINIKDRTGTVQFNFPATVSKTATKSLNAGIRAMEIHRQTGIKIEMINPNVRGWMHSPGRYKRSAMKRELNVCKEDGSVGPCANSETSWDIVRAPDDG